MTKHTKTLSIGSRAKVWRRTADITTGGLTRDNLLQNKHGRIVSRKKHETAKKEMRLVKHGYGAKKGKFGTVKLSSHKGRTKKRSSTRKRRKSR
jgi:hypothetical protein